MSPSRRPAVALVAAVALAAVVVAPHPAAAAAPAVGPTAPAWATRGNADSPQQPGAAATQPRGAYVAPLPARQSRATPRAGATTRASDVFGFAQAGEVSSGAWQSDIQFNILTTLAYFGVPMNGDGTLNTTANDYYATWQGAQMTSLMQTAHAAGDRVVLTITAFDSATINSITAVESTRQTAIASITHQLLTRGGDGVNIDFEGGDSSEAANLTTFISELRGALNSLPSTQRYLTIDTYASAAMYPELWNISALAASVDAFDIMDYDITSPASANAGPVAPLAGSQYSTVNVVNSYLAKVPATQVILGVPYYGYKWSTTDTSASTRPPANAATNGGADADTYSGALDDFSCALSLQQYWDSPTSEPWASWWSPSSGDPCGGDHGAWRELYWENQTSLGDKYSQVVNADELRGIGIWALGYDSGHGELWNLIATSLRGYPLTPSAPQSLAVSSSGPQTATVSWQTPRFPVGNQYPMTQYAVTPHDQWGNAGTPRNVSGSTLSATFSGLPDGAPVYFTVSATDSAGGGPAAASHSVTPAMSVAPPAGAEAVTTSAQQFALPNSDGSTWQVLGGTSLSRTWTPASATEASITVSADLWSTQAGVNVDVGVLFDGTLIGWKEAGTERAFTPIAATLQALTPATASAHTVQVVWKTNQPVVGVTAVAAAGSASAANGYSPSRLLIAPVPMGGTGNAGGATAVTPAGTQDLWMQPGSDGSTWRELDRRLTFAITPAHAATYTISGNADLWTMTAGVNQDLGLAVDGTVVAWKESGGATAFSPKATFVSATVVLAGGSTHWVTLEWKANVPAPGVTIVAGAGGTGSYSPSRLTAVLDSTAPAAVTAVDQPSAPNAAPGVWSPADRHLVLGLPGGATTTLPVLAGLDVWSSGAPALIDVGIDIDGTVVAWKEVGLGTAYSPCAAWVGVTWTFSGSGPHTVSVVWRVTDGGGTRFAGAGGNPPYSPSTLTVG